ncbi:MAG: serine/threonine protein kinase, partial [Myxococcales bacterium]|nr:serine/threonine protein kinase [Myxococcales bacterium]
MGVVYRAHDDAADRVVALKTVAVASPHWIESIRREIDALTRIRHPGVVRILDHGVHEGRPWYAMDFLDGENLREFGARIWSPFSSLLSASAVPPTLTRTRTATGGESDLPDRRSSVPPASGTRFVGSRPAAAGELPQVLSIGRRLCATLAFLHGEGVVSCDLKPENIVLSGGTPVIIDFGISRRFPAATGREAMDAQAHAGTWHYMSPEHRLGELVDARSDLYAVGCILYELLTGVQASIGAPSPSELVRDLSPALDALVMRLLSWEPNKRASFADDIAATLAELAEDADPLKD